MLKKVLLIFCFVSISSTVFAENLVLAVGTIYDSADDLMFIYNDNVKRGFFMEHDVHATLDLQFNIPSSAFNNMPSNPSGINVYSATSEMWFWVTPGNVNGQWIVLDDGPKNGQPATFFNDTYNFYNSLPNYVLNYRPDPSSVDGFSMYLTATYLTNFTSSQAALEQALNNFKNSSLANDPFVKSGFLGVNSIKLIKDDGNANNYTGSPSQYSRATNNIYVNANDLANYGYIVLFHELIQAGITNALFESYITNAQHASIVDMNKNYFSRFDGYVGVSSDYHLNSGKAFAIGYTYKMFARYYNELPLAEKTKADRYFNDIESNKFIARLDLATISASMNLHIIGRTGIYKSGDKYKNVTQADIDHFVSSFTDDSSSINNVIRSVASTLDSELKRKQASEMIPPLSLLLF